MAHRAGFFLLLTFGIFSCNEARYESGSNENPAAEGFNLANSDPAAVELADSIMVAMGGRNAWDITRFITWTFDNRKLFWDKESSKVRIESDNHHVIYLFNINTWQGRVQIDGNEMLHRDSLQEMLNRAKQIWINDSYWLIMPFKLKDNGVTLKYLGEDSLQNAKYNVLQLTFSNRADTPEDKYLLYVDLKDNLVKRWAYFEKANQDSASDIRPFDNYKKYNNILLSADRSDGKGPKNVRVVDQLPETIFTEF
jgi:hypothetical protein